MTKSLNPPPTSPSYILYDSNTKSLKIQGENFSNAIEYIFSYTNENGVTETISSGTNSVSIPCNPQNCEPLSVYYSYTTPTDASDNSPIATMYCGNLPDAPTSYPNIIWNNINLTVLNFNYTLNINQLPLTGYRLYMKMKNESQFNLVFDGINNPELNYASISSYNGEPLSNIAYEFAFSVLNFVGESKKSPVLTFIPSILPNFNNTIVSETGLIPFQSNSKITLTISSYDDNNNPITSGGLIYMLDVRNYCVQNATNPYQCDRVTSDDPRYNADIIDLPLNQIFYDLNNGQYTTNFSVPSAGWITVSTYLLTVGGLRGQYYDYVKIDSHIPFHTQIDSQINTNWDSIIVSDSVSDFYGVRWTGGIRPPKTDIYTFYAQYRTGVRIWINYKLVLDNWDVCCEDAQFSILLVENSFNDIRIESKKNNGAVSVILMWESDTILREVIPSKYFYYYNFVGDVIYKGVQISQGSQNDYDAIIIGAGISGIGVAMQLQQNNLNYLILEARQRSGGRMYTETLGNTSVNIGASYIYGMSSENPIYELTQKYNLTFKTVNNGSIHTYYNDGNETSRFPLYELRKMRRLYKQTLRHAGNVFQDYLLNKANICKKKEDFSVKDAIDLAIDTNPELKKLLNEKPSFKDFWNLFDWAGEQGEAVPYRDDSLMRWQNRPHFKGGDGELEKGYGALIEELIQGLNIQTNTEVLSIENYNTTSINVITTKGNYTASKVIVTVPLGVLKNNQINFVPKLPDWKQGAINRLKMGLLNKVYILFDNQFWSDDISEIQYFSSIKGQFPWMDVYSKSNNILLFWLSGEFAENLENLDDHTIINQIMTILTSIYGEGFANIVDYYITRWGTQKFTRGSYSGFAKGSKQSDNDALGKNVDNLYFCGEATNKNYLGTVQGAYMSGLRVAKEILNN